MFIVEFLAIAAAFTLGYLLGKAAPASSAAPTSGGGPGEEGGKSAPRPVKPQSGGGPGEEGGGDPPPKP